MQFDSREDVICLAKLESHRTLLAMPHKTRPLKTRERERRRGYRFADSPGSTLIELLVVISIIAFLLALLMTPVTYRYRLLLLGKIRVICVGVDSIGRFIGWADSQWRSGLSMVRTCYWQLA
jgi:hypothetical protein